MTTKPTNAVAAAAAIMAKVVSTLPCERKAAEKLVNEAGELEKKFGKKGPDLFVSHLRNDQIRPLYLAKVGMEVAPRYVRQVLAVVDAQRKLRSPDDQTAWNLGDAFEEGLSKHHRLCRSPEAARLVLAASPHADDPWLLCLLANGSYTDGWRYWGWPAGWCLSRDIIDSLVEQKKITAEDRITYAKAMQR